MPSPMWTMLSLYKIRKVSNIMNLQEFREHVLATRKASTMEAMSSLSATISTTTNEKENK